MSRIRTLKPEWLEDEALIECSLAARVLSAALLLLADDYGNGRAGEKILAARVFPGEPARVLREALAELVGIRYVIIYLSDGQTYFHIRNWAKHQKVDKPGTPRVPAPPRECLANPPDGPAKAPEEPPKAPGTLAPRAGPAPAPDPGTGPEGGVGETTDWPARIRERERKPGEYPRPRHDPMQEPIPFSRWFASQQHIDWGREVRLPDDRFDAAIVAARNKLKGAYTIEYWDDKARKFLEAELKAFTGNAAAGAESNAAEDAALAQRARRGEYGPEIKAAAERGEQAGALRELVRKRAQRLTAEPASSPRQADSPQVQPGAVASLVAGIGRAIP